MASQAQGRVYLSNAFSLSMVDVQDKPVTLELREAIEERLGVREGSITKALGVDGDNIEIIVRDDARRLRTKLRQEIEKKLNERGR